MDPSPERNRGEDVSSIFPFFFTGNSRNQVLEYAAFMTYLSDKNLWQAF